MLESFCLFVSQVRGARRRSGFRTATRPFRLLGFVAAVTGGGYRHHAVSGMASTT